MLAHDLAAALIAERERDLSYAASTRQLPPRPPFVARARGRLLAALRPAPVRAPSRSPRVLARDLGEVVTAASARAGDTRGQGAC